jgi:hypothetical protein
MLADDASGTIRRDGLATRVVIGPILAGTIGKISGRAIFPRDQANRSMELPPQAASILLHVVFAVSAPVADREALEKPWVALD